MIRVAAILLNVLTVLSVLSADSLALAEGGLTVSPPIPLYSTYVLPAETQTMTDAEFFTWASDQNTKAEQACAERAYEYRLANPARTASETVVRFTPNQVANKGRHARNGAVLRGDVESKSYELRYRDLNDSGGGPLLIVNPYFRKRENVRFADRASVMPSK